MAKKVKLSKEEKWEQDNQEFVNTVVGLSPAELNVRIGALSKNMEEVSESLEENMEPGMPLREAKDEYSQLRAPFNDAKKLLKQKTKYVYRLLKQKGGK